MKYFQNAAQEAQRKVFTILSYSEEAEIFSTSQGLLVNEVKACCLLLPS